MPCETSLAPIPPAWSPPLATNGVSNPRLNFSNSPAVQANYGGTGAARGSPTFPGLIRLTAAGTNGQPISATFQPMIVTTDLGQVVFNFVLGQSPIRFGNSAAIVINDYSSATPYPSTINVSGLAGLLTRPPLPCPTSATLGPVTLMPCSCLPPAKNRSLWPSAAAVIR